MKAATSPLLPVGPGLRQAVEQELREGEFIARGLVSRDKARRGGAYSNADAVLNHLENMLVCRKATACR